MTIFFALLIAVAAVILLGIGLAHEVRRDGYGHRPPPRSHFDDEDLRWPGNRHLAV